MRKSKRKFPTKMDFQKKTGKMKMCQKWTNFEKLAGTEKMLRVQGQKINVNRLYT